MVSMMRLMQTNRYFSLHAHATLHMSTYFKQCLTEPNICAKDTSDCQTVKIVCSSMAASTVSLLKGSLWFGLKEAQVEPRCVSPK